MNNMKNLFLLILAILPIAILCTYIYNKDSEKEPASLLIGLFFSGIASCILVFIINIIMELTIPFFSYDTDNMNMVQLAIYIFVGVALVEEGCKWIFARLIGFKNKNFDQPFDIIVYTTFISLGFATLENIVYVMEFGASAAILRALTSIPGHTCFGVVMGYYLLLAKLSYNNNNHKLYKKNILLSLFLPILTHGIYDYFLFLENGIFLIFLLILFIIFFIYSYKKVKQISNLKQKLFYQTKHCPNCGRVVKTPFCPSCGNKNE